MEFHAKKMFTACFYYASACEDAGEGRCLHYCKIVYLAFQSKDAKQYFDQFPFGCLFSAFLEPTPHMYFCLVTDTNNE